MTEFTGFARRAHFGYSNGIFVTLQDGGGDQTQMADLTKGLHSDQITPDVTVHAQDARVRRNQVGGVFGRHGMAGRAAEYRGIAVFPGRRQRQQNAQNPNAHD
jgi:hypothetical protein